MSSTTEGGVGDILKITRELLQHLDVTTLSPQLIESFESRLWAGAEAIEASQKLTGSNYDSIFNDLSATSEKALELFNAEMFGEGWALPEGLDEDDDDDLAKVPDLGDKPISGAMQILALLKFKAPDVGRLFPSSMRSEFYDYLHLSGDRKEETTESTSQTNSSAPKISSPQPEPTMGFTLQVISHLKILEGLYRLEGQNILDAHLQAIRLHRTLQSMRAHGSQDGHFRTLTTNLLQILVSEVWSRLKSWSANIRYHSDNDRWVSTLSVLVSLSSTLGGLNVEVEDGTTDLRRGVLNRSRRAVRTELNYLFSTNVCQGCGEALRAFHMTCCGSRVCTRCLHISCLYQIQYGPSERQYVCPFCGKGEKRNLRAALKEDSIVTEICNNTLLRGQLIPAQKAEARQRGWLGGLFPKDEEESPHGETTTTATTASTGPQTDF